MPPKASAQALAEAAAKAEREINVLQAQKAVVQAEVNLVTARRNKKESDVRSLNVLTAAENAVPAAVKARGEAVAALEKPLGDYTHFTPIYPATSTGRRTALARWLTSPDNPLAARVAINHIWLRHFGSPLVPSVFDFGINGKPPTNQALLDWLARELIENGWRMKAIHKLIVMSRTYRLASTARMTNDQVPMTNDPENVYYWRANVRRMEAEAVRDSVLQIAGTLDLTRGGPDLDPNAGLTTPRRSLYFRTAKEKKVEFLSLFDSANPVECYRRSESIAPQQALAMANSTLTLAQARVLAKKITDSIRIDGTEQRMKRFAETAFVRILCRRPSEDEMDACLKFLDEQGAVLSDAKNLTAFSSGPGATIAPSADGRQRALENLVHVLFNHNDFVTVR
jgi:hypothetical protein